MRKCQYWFQLQQEAVPTGRSPLFDLFQNLQMAVEKNYATLHQVEDYARLLFMTPRQLNQAAQKYSGKNVSLMIQHRLVIEAKRQLFYSGDTIGQIAEQLGFVDIAHFSKFIKRHTGFTPSWWKNPVTRFGHG